jgi:hypothetical protein
MSPICESGHNVFVEDGSSLLQSAQASRLPLWVLNGVNQDLLHMLDPAHSTWHLCPPT